MKCNHNISNTRGQRTEEIMHLRIRCFHPWPELRNMPQERALQNKMSRHVFKYYILWHVFYQVITVKWRNYFDQHADGGRRCQQARALLEAWAFPPHDDSASRKRHPPPYFTNLKRCCVVRSPCLRCLTFLVCFFMFTQFMYDNIFQKWLAFFFMLSVMPDIAPFSKHLVATNFSFFEQKQSGEKKNDTSNATTPN